MLTTDCLISKLDLLVFVSSVNKKIPFRLLDCVNELPWQEIGFLWICWKIFFSDNVEWSSKNLWKMVSTDVKANLKQQEIKDLVAVSYKFFLDVYFSFWFWLIFPNRVFPVFHIGDHFWADQNWHPKNLKNIFFPTYKFYSLWFD